MSERTAGPDAQAVKACCAELYSRDAIRWLLGETLHPGGLALTGRLAELTRLGSADHVLDVAAGFGQSALFLSRTVGCRVDGLDLSPPNLARAGRSAQGAGLHGTVRFLAGDADALPYRDGVFDAVLSECAFCTFPDKGKAAREISRVLAPGGRLGLADVTLRPESLPDDLRGVLLQAACLSDARTAEGYRGLLAEAGFHRFLAEEHPEAVSALLEEIRARLLLARLASLSGQWRFDGVDLEAVEAIVTRAEELVRDDVIGYVLLVGERSDGI